MSTLIFVGTLSSRDLEGLVNPLNRQTVPPQDLAFKRGVVDELGHTLNVVDHGKGPIIFKIDDKTA